MHIDSDPQKQALTSNAERPHVGNVYGVPGVGASSVASTLAAMPKGSLVFVSADYAKHFKPVPKDGHTYLVQDPERLWVHHMLQPDGTHIVLGLR